MEPTEVTGVAPSVPTGVASVGPPSGGADLQDIVDCARFVEHASCGICWCTIGGSFLQVNAALVELLGYDSVEEVLGLDMYRDVYVNPEDREQAIRQYRKAVTYKDCEVRWKRKDGRVITVLIGGRPLRNFEGGVIAFEDIVQDVTERRALEGQVRQLQKMQAVGRLAGGIAHDFNNVLTNFFGYLTILERRAEDPGEVRECVAHLRKGAERSRKLVQQILSFSRPRPTKRQIVAVHRVVESARAFLARTVGPAVRVETVLTARPDHVKADPFQLEQVLLNLAVNARDALPEGGTLRMETAIVRTGESDARRLALSAGEYVRLRVRDTGVGMDPATAARVFDPFFTTKKPGQGTGLGLSIVYGIIVQAGGRIFLKTAPGKGTTFEIWLPRVAAPRAPSEARVVAPTGPASRDRRAETILIVEDEKDIRILLRRFLEEAGYRVVEAENGVAGVAAFEAHRNDVALILTDVQMPELNGYLMASRIFGIAGRKLPVLYLSGYADTTTIPPGAMHATTRFLGKPIDMRKLVEEAGRLLETHRSLAGRHRG